MTTKLIVLAGFLVAFAAGLVTGVQRRDVVAPEAKSQVPPNPGSLLIPTTRPTTGPRGTPPPSFFSRELGLSQDQREKLFRIWDGVVSGGRELDDRRREARQLRDNQIIELASAEARQQYLDILQKFYDQSDKIQEEFEVALNKAIEETNQILTPAQQEKYKQILTRIDSERPGWNDRGGRRNGRGGDRRGGRGPRQDGFRDGQDGRADKSAATRPEQVQ